jgi:hypothetical protein
MLTELETRILVCVELRLDSRGYPGLHLGKDVIEFVLPVTLSQDLQEIVGKVAVL